MRVNRHLHRPSLSSIVLGVTGLAFSVLARAEVQSLDAIREAAGAVVEQRLAAEPGTTRVSVSRLDARLRLPACGADLQASAGDLRRPGGHATVEVRCPSPRPWTLYVPVTIERRRDVVVLARPLSRGDAITPAHLDVSQRDIGALPAGHYSEPDALVGMVARRHLDIGAVVTPAAVRAETLVRRGDRVQVVAAVGTLQVRSVAEALVAGTLGERIRVRHPVSRRAFDATVEGRGLVSVKP